MILNTHRNVSYQNTKFTIRSDNRSKIITRVISRLRHHLTHWIRGMCVISTPVVSGGLGFRGSTTDVISRCIGKCGLLKTSPMLSTRQATEGDPITRIMTIHHNTKINLSVLLDCSAGFGIFFS